MNGEGRVTPRFWMHNAGQGNSFRPVNASTLHLRPEIAAMVAALVEDGFEPAVGGAVVAINVRE